MNLLKTIVKLLLLLVVAATIAAVVAFFKKPNSQPVSFEHWPDVARKSAA